MRLENKYQQEVNWEAYLTAKDPEGQGMMGRNPD